MTNHSSNAGNFLHYRECPCYERSQDEIELMQIQCLCFILRQPPFGVVDANAKQDELIQVATGTDGEGQTVIAYRPVPVAQDDSGTRVVVDELAEFTDQQLAALWDRMVAIFKRRQQEYCDAMGANTAETPDEDRKLDENLARYFKTGKWHGGQEE